MSDTDRTTVPQSTDAGAGRQVPIADRIFIDQGQRYANLAEACQVAQEDYRKLVKQGEHLELTLRQTLHPDVWKLVHDALEDRGRQADHFADMLAAELGRHLPGLAPVIGLLWEHVKYIAPQNVGHCCVGEGSFEPGVDDDGQS